MKKVVFLLCIFLSACSVERMGNRKMNWVVKHDFLRRDTLVMRYYIIVRDTVYCK